MSAERRLFSNSGQAEAPPASKESKAFLPIGEHTSDGYSQRRWSKPLPTGCGIMILIFACAGICELSFGGLTDEAPMNELAVQLAQNEQKYPAAVVEPATAPQRLEKTPLPSAEEQKQATELVRSIHQSDIDSAKSPENKVELARALLAEARETANDPAGQYALFKAALDLAIGAGDVKAALDIWKAVSSNFQVDGPAGKLAIFKKAAKEKGSKDELKKALKQFSQECVSEDRFDLARNALKMLSSSNDPKEAKQYATELANLDKIAAKYDEAKSAFAALKSNSTDPQANLVAGKFLCFMKHDWTGGLLLLRLVDDTTLASLAKADLSEPVESDKLLSLADAWWAFSEKHSDDKFAQIASQERATLWYRKALPKLTGLPKAKA